MEEPWFQMARLIFKAIALSIRRAQLQIRLRGQKQ
jgi:hypothetical protein